MLKMMRRANPEGGDLAKKLNTYDMIMPPKPNNKMIIIRAPEKREETMFCKFSLFAIVSDNEFRRKYSFSSNTIV